MQEHEKRKEYRHSILSSTADREGIEERHRYQLGSVLLFVVLLFGAWFLVVCFFFFNL